MKIFDYKEVKMNWDSFTYPIAVGTPVSIDGVLADNASAHGLIARTVFAKPDADETLKVMTGGIIDMEEIVAGYGQELSSAAVQALCGIHFYKDGVCIPSGGSGGGVTPEIMAQIENAQWKTESSDQLFSETVTTALNGNFYDGELASNVPITADTLKVTFNDVEYICAGRPIEDENGVEYGAPFNQETGYDFSEYPFSIASFKGMNIVTTQSPGTYTVSVSTETITTTDTFKNEVKELSNVIQIISGVTTTEEVNNALQDGKLLYFYNTVTDATRPALRIITGHSTVSDRYDFTPADSSIIAVNSDGMFRVLLSTN